MKAGWAFFKPQHARQPSLHRAIAGRILTGILVEEDNLLLRFVDATLRIDLNTRVYKFQSVLVHWLTLPGWLRVTRVIEDQHQVILEISGGLFTARIVVRETEREWHITFQGGRILASV
jgi:hypothetical protein